MGNKYFRRREIRGVGPDSRFARRNRVESNFVMSDVLEKFKFLQHLGKIDS